MLEFAGRNAVVTGAASGIGLAMAERFASLGMRVLMADVEPSALDAAVGSLRAAGHVVEGCVTNVANEESVRALAARTAADLGPVHLLCNNAGIGAGAVDTHFVWEASRADWNWALGVNLWGVIHGLAAFVPAMLAHGEEAHIVNTASRAGLMSGWGVYGTTKHAVVALSESLSAQLQMIGAPIGVSILCPGAVRTRLTESGRNRPAGSVAPGTTSSGSADSPEPTHGPAHLMERIGAALRARIAQGRKPPAVVDALVAGIRAGEFYILMEDQDLIVIERRFATIHARRPPVPPPLPAHDG
ncbi:MAG: SDR family NAD(P)-dependent oxidoreductase [Burkholderiales bacterium]